MVLDVAFVSFEEEKNDSGRAEMQIRQYPRELYRLFRHSAMSSGCDKVIMADVSGDKAHSF